VAQLDPMTRRDVFAAGEPTTPRSQKNTNFTSQGSSHRILGGAPDPEGVQLIREWITALPAPVP